MRRCLLACQIVTRTAAALRRLLFCVRTAAARLPQLLGRLTLKMLFILVELEPHVPLRLLLTLAELILLLKTPQLLRVGGCRGGLPAMGPVLALVLCPASAGRRQFCAANPGMDFCRVSASLCFRRVSTSLGYSH